MGTLRKLAGKAANKAAKKLTAKWFRENSKLFTAKRISILSENTLNDRTTAAIKHAKRALGNMKRFGYGVGEYYDDIETWLNYEPRTLEEKREKLEVLGDFVSDKNVSTVSGYRNAIEKPDFLAKAIGEGYDGKRYDSETALSFLKWKYPDSKDVKSFRDVGKNRKEIERELWNWHLQGEP